MVSGS
ncbi:hypothetical protein MTR67_006812 [Solanum verrucosum]